MCQNTVMYGVFWGLKNALILTKKKKKWQQREHYNCTVIWGLGWRLGLTVKSHRNGTPMGSDYDWSLWRRNRHFQKPVIFTLAGDAVAILGPSLNEFDTHFVLFELYKESAKKGRYKNTALCPAHCITHAKKWQDGGHLLIWDVNTDWFPVSWSCSCAVKFSDYLY